MTVYDVVPWLLAGWVLTAGYAYWLWLQNREMAASVDRATELIERVVEDAEAKLPQTPHPRDTR